MKIYVMCNQSIGEVDLEILDVLLYRVVTLCGRSKYTCIPVKWQRNLHREFQQYK